ncbi:MAG TPA: 4-alpha-glucanotransferase [Candidatus Omnitrophota bacterium]|nr:4-alpha-glucanotransferase [Candidatus Omnitrophota bacterium]
MPEPTMNVTRREDNPPYERGSGILLHISSLPSAFGIGDFGPGATRFVDFLSEAGQKYWQILPLSPTMPVYGNSPYSSDSAFAINPLFISPDVLLSENWIHGDDVSSLPDFPSGRVDFDKVGAVKSALLFKAFDTFSREGRDLASYDLFCGRNAGWLDAYAEYKVLKEEFGGQVWSQWPSALRHRQPRALQDVHEKFSNAIRRIKFWQFLAWKQWVDLKSYCQEKNIRIIGDIPIYVNYDSSDVWSSPHIFQLDQNSVPAFVAGVPPDYFSKTGQRWGNPVYDWDALQKEKFQWWIGRIRHKLCFYDIIRIDHFRGLVAFWKIPAQEETAVKGEWAPVPTDNFFRALLEAFPRLPIIAEDLGIITDDVKEKMDKLNFPGMKVLIFAFGEDIKTHPYIPENYSQSCVAYTGTHDNNTVQGWYQHEITEEEKKNLLKYFETVNPSQLHWQMIDAVLRSPAVLAIFPLQDILGLGQEARMNIPGTSSGNWTWRFAPESLTPRLAEKIARQVRASRR